MFGAAGCSAPLEQPGLIQKCFTHARHSANLYLKRVMGTCRQAFQNIAEAGSIEFTNGTFLPAQLCIC